MIPDPRAEALAALAKFQVTEASVRDTLHRISEIALAAVPEASIAGMSMMGDDGNPTTAIFTDEASPEIDLAQYRERNGPCLDAWREARVVVVPRVRDVADTYPAFTEACLDHGVESTLSTPMIAGTVALGAMNLYSSEPGAFSES